MVCNFSEAKLLYKPVCPSLRTQPLAQSCCIAPVTVTLSVPFQYTYLSYFSTQFEDSYCPCSRTFTCPVSIILTYLSYFSTQFEDSYCPCSRTFTCPVSIILTYLSYFSTENPLPAAWKMSLPNLKTRLRKHLPKSRTKYPPIRTLR